MRVEKVRQELGKGHRADRPLAPGDEVEVLLKEGNWGAGWVVPSELDKEILSGIPDRQRNRACRNKW